MNYFDLEAYREQCAPYGSQDAQPALRSCIALPVLEFTRLSTVASALSSSAFASALSSCHARLKLLGSPRNEITVPFRYMSIT